MRKASLSLILSSLLIISLTPAAFAQQPAGQSTEQHQKDKQPNEGANHAQDSQDRGSPGAATTGAATGAPPAQSSSPAGQPPTATGEDLKGPPAQFPPNKTPE